MMLEQQLLDKLTSIEELLSKQNLFKKEVLDLGEACQYLNVSASYIYKLTHTDRISHYIPTGKKIFFKRCELDEFILSNRQSSGAEIEKAATDYVTSSRRGRRL